MTRAEGERERLLHSIARMRSTLIGLEKALTMNGPVGLEAAQAVVMSATEIALQVAKLDAYDLVENDAKA